MPSSDLKEDIMHINKAINGLIKYIDKHVYPDMNGLQQVGYMLLAENLKASPDTITDLLGKNIFLRMLLSVDENGEINIDRMRVALTRAIATKGHIDIEVPMYGKFTIRSEDVNEIMKFIAEEKPNEANTQSY